MDSFEKKTEKDKLSSFDTSHSEIVIKSVSYDQQEILNNILKLHVPSGVYDCDLTTSKGNFYKNGVVPMPRLKYDKHPQVEGVQPWQPWVLGYDGCYDSDTCPHGYLVTDGLFREKFNSSHIYQSNSSLIVTTFWKIPL
jgi:hypothetical protein